jgi:hypothetical protein
VATEPAAADTTPTPADEAAPARRGGFSFSATSGNDAEEEPAEKPAGDDTAAADPAESVQLAAVEPANPRPLDAAKPAATTPTAATGNDAAANANIVFVNVNATPWATISIDGVEVGETPLGEVPLEIGPHTFRAVMADGRVLEESRNIDRNSTRILFR